MEHKVYNSWITFEPSEDVPGQWLVHALEFDVVTQGDSLAHAWEMVKEAVAMVVLDDVARGVDPRERRAPDEYWSRLHKILAHSVPVPGGISELAKEPSVRAAAVQAFFEITIEHRRPAPRISDTPTNWDAPVLQAQC